MNKTMIMNMATPVIATLATYLAAQFPLLDQVAWNSLITSIAVAGVTGALAYINRPQALKDTVGNMDKTTVVTTAASAEALPNNPDVVAVTPEIAAAIKKAS